MSATFDTLLALDRKLAAKGFLPMTERWAQEARRFYDHPTALRWVARVGRGGTKSTMLVKLAMNETLFGDWAVPPGEVHYAVFVSENKDEAAARLRLIEAQLDALRIVYSRSGEVITLAGKHAKLRRGFRVAAARVGAVSGWRAFWKCADELAKWGARDDGADPPAEVLASMNAMSITHSKARELDFSSPFGHDDLHFALMARGDTDDQIVSEGPTWEWNPSITIEETRRREPDDKVWRREYLAVPQATVTAAFDFDKIEQCFREPPPLLKSEPVMIVDASSGGGDAFAWMIARWGLRLREGATAWWARWGPDGRLYRKPGARDGSRPEWAWGEDADGRYLWWREAPEDHEVNPDESTLLVEKIGAVEGKFALSEAPRVFEAAARDAKRYGARTVIGDQRDATACMSEFGRRGLNYTSIPWSNESKRVAVELVRRWMMAGRLVLPPHDTMRKQLLQYRTKITASGYEVFEGRGRHDDHAALIVSLAHAEMNGKIPRSPTHKPPVRGTMKFWPGIGA